MRPSLRAQRIDLKHVSVAAIVRGIDQNFEIVIKILRQVTAQFCRHDALGLGIVTDDPEIHLVSRIQNSNLCFFRGRAAFIGLPLAKVTDRIGQLPQGVI